MSPRSITIEHPSDSAPQLIREPWGKNAYLWCLIAILCVCVYVAFGAWQYSVLRGEALERQAVDIKLRIDRMAIQSELNLTQTSTIQAFGSRIKNSALAESVSIYDSIDLIWSDTGQSPTAQDYQLHKQFTTDAAISHLVVDHPLFHWSWWQSILPSSKVELKMAFRFNDRSGQGGIVLLVPVIDQSLLLAMQTSQKLLIGVTLLIFLLGGLVLLLWRFRRRYVNPKPIEMDQQITKLESLLQKAKDHHHSMRTASSHAVQLNEQFLRRVGSDLHDGPSQSISYAILRLRHYQNSELVKEIGYEYFALIESLEAALNEIRGISKGLVLPELEGLSVHQCIRKVVALTKSKSPTTDIEELYQDLPNALDMGVKICVYRFVQEGLNNAIQHGQAKQIRVFAGVKGSVLTISLKDNGMGFRVSKLDAENNRLGIVGLRDRIESIGGKFNINSVIGVGTALKLTIPLSTQDNTA